MLKDVYKFSENNVLTGFAGVVWLDAKTPCNPPGETSRYNHAIRRRIRL
jgi:hypothetical protein